MKWALLVQSAGTFHLSRTKVSPLLQCHRFASSSPSRGPLDGVKVLDLTRILAGPMCTMLLGDLGAEVFKIEKPKTGDDTRAWGPPFVGTEAAYYLSVNRNKKSITVDMKKEEGRELLYKLAKKCDVLVENYVPGKLDELGFGYETMKKVNPALVYCSITGWGSTGPYSQRAGLDVIAASVGGLLHITGPENGDPCKPGVALTDLSTGLYAHGAIMAALIHRDKTGEGQRIECNLLSTQVSCLANIASNYLNLGKEAVRLGTAHESVVPYQAFPTEDGYITIGCGNNHNFSTLCRILEKPDLANDEKYANNRLRVTNRKTLIDSLSELFQKRTTKEWLDRLENCGFAYGPINKIAEVFDDPQVKHLGLMKEIPHPTAKAVKVVGPAVKYSESDCSVKSAPPLLGENTDEVLQGELGLTEEDLRKLRTANVI